MVWAGFDTMGVQLGQAGFGLVCGRLGWVGPSGRVSRVRSDPVSDQLGWVGLCDRVGPAESGPVCDRLG